MNFFLMQTTQIDEKMFNNERAKPTDNVSTLYRNGL